MATTKRAGHNAETQRLTDNHAVFKDLMGGLLMAPVDLQTSGKRILDSACADGLWLRELRASVLPAEHEYLGNDIEPEIFPEDKGGLELFQQSSTAPWPEDFKGSFDLVHQRLLLAGSYPLTPEQVLVNLIELVKPGGWLELVEVNSFGPMKRGPALTDMFRLMRELFTATGAGDYVSQMQGWVEKAGLVNVQERTFECKIGALAKPELKEQSINGIAAALPPLIAVSKNLPTTFKEGELEGLEDRLRAELASQGGRYEMRAVWGQKPSA